jgi:hypothetical protein
MALEDGSGAAVALKNGDGAAALGGRGGWRLKIAAAVLGGSGGRRTCDDGIGVSIVEAEGLLLRRWCQRWQGRQERTFLMRGKSVGSDSKEIGVSWWQRWWW